MYYDYTLLHVDMHVCFMPRILCHQVVVANTYIQTCRTLFKLSITPFLFPCVLRIVICLAIQLVRWILWACDPLPHQGRPNMCRYILILFRKVEFWYIYIFLKKVPIAVWMPKLFFSGSKLSHEKCSFLFYFIPFSRPFLYLSINMSTTTIQDFSCDDPTQKGSI